MSHQSIIPRQLPVRNWRINWNGHCSCFLVMHNRWTIGWNALPCHWRNCPSLECRPHPVAILWRISCLTPNFQWGMESLHCHTSRYQAVFPNNWQHCHNWVTRCVNSAIVSRRIDHYQVDDCGYIHSGPCPIIYSNRSIRQCWRSMNRHCRWPRIDQMSP